MRIQAIIFGKGGFFEKDNLIPFPDDKKKETYMFESTKQEAGKIPSAFIKVDKKGKQMVLIFKDKGKHSFVKIDSEKAQKYAIPQIMEYLSQRAGKYASRIDQQGFWEKHGTAFIIAVAMVLFAVGSWFNKEGAEAQAESQLVSAGAYRELLSWLKDNVGSSPPI